MSGYESASGETALGKIICSYSEAHSVPEGRWTDVLSNRDNVRVILTSVQGKIPVTPEVEGTTLLRSDSNSVTLNSYKDSSKERNMYIEFSCRTDLPKSVKIDFEEPEHFKRDLEKVLKSSSIIECDRLKEKVIRVGGTDVRDVSVIPRIICNPTNQQVGEITHHIMTLLGFRDVVEG